MADLTADKLILRFGEDQTPQDIEVRNRMLRKWFAGAKERYGRDQWWGFVEMMKQKSADHG